MTHTLRRAAHPYPDHWSRQATTHAIAKFSHCLPMPDDTCRTCPRIKSAIR